MPTMLVDTARLMTVALQQEGKPYLYKRKGPEAFDCSGLITYAMFKAHGPDWRFTHNAHSLWSMLLPLARPDARDVCIACYGYTPEHIDHVMLCVGDGRVFGACGGGSDCLTLEDAKRLGAKVQFRSHPDYRKPPKSSPLIGFRVFALPDLKIVPPPKESPNG